MIVFSKLAIADDVGSKYLGPFDSVPYLCHEFGHTWNSSCFGTWKNTFIHGFMYSFKLYAPLYMLGAFMKLRNEKVDKKKLFKSTLRGILQSSVFLGMTGTLFLFSFCSYGAIFGKYHGVFALVIGFISSLLSIILERKSRRSLLAVYVLNLALETLFKMAVSRGYVKPINRGEVLIFAATNMIYLALFRGSRLPTGIQNMFQSLLGKEETGAFEAGLPFGRLIPQSFRRKYDSFVSWLNTLGPNAPSCRHEGGCVGYVLYGTLKYYAIGYALEILLQYRHIFRAVANGKLFDMASCFSQFSLAKFLCGYMTLFRGVNCILRWSSGQDYPEIFGAVSGFLSGLSAIYYPSTSITMYALSKLLDILCMKAVAANWLPYFPNFDSFIYSASMAVVFHASVFEPHNIRPGYWTFMCGLSGDKYPLMFRILLDKFGTQASKMYLNFVPDLDMRTVKTGEIKRALALFGKWPYSLS